MKIGKNLHPTPYTLPPEKTFSADPNCGSHHRIKNGSIHNGKLKRQCKECGRQFVINPTNKTVSGGASTALRESVKHAVRSPALANKVVVIDPSWGNSRSRHRYSHSQSRRNRTNIRFFTTKSPDCHHSRLLLNRCVTLSRFTAYE